MKTKSAMWATTQALAAAIPAATSAQTTRVDTARVRANMDNLRTYLTGIQTNAALAWASADPLRADVYLRDAARMTGNAKALAMNITKELGPPTHVPLGWGATRACIARSLEHLHHVIVMGDYTAPIGDAK